jgi:hypothetical protein
MTTTNSIDRVLPRHAIYNISTVFCAAGTTDCHGVIDARIVPTRAKFNGDCRIQKKH